MGEKTARAVRPFFVANPDDSESGLFAEDEIDFTWHLGMSWQVRQRSWRSMHARIEERCPDLEGRILEVSTKSEDHELGRALSAFNLMLEDVETGKIRPLENWFQSAKVFRVVNEDGSKTLFGPFLELLGRDPLEAKRFVDAFLPKETALKYQDDPLFVEIQGELKGASFEGFKFKDRAFPSEPKSAFYDYLYVKALYQGQNDDLSKRLLEFRAFTDIEFNPKKNGKVIRYNTQARACAIFVSLCLAGKLDVAVEDIDSFIDIVGYCRSKNKPEEENGNEEQMALLL